MKDCIIVTGSSGLIGSAFIDRIGERFVEFGFDREGPPHPPPKTEYVIDCDLGSDQSVLHALNEARRLGGARIASVIHLAAYYDFSGAPSPKYNEITVRGTERLLRGLRDFAVEQFVFSSTILVHAPCETGERINEDWPLEPKWDYPKSKVATEQLIRAQHGNIPIVLLRIAGVYDDRCHSIPLAHQIQRIYERKLISRVFPGDASHGQSFLHLEDLLDALVNIIERRRRLPPELILLLGEDQTLSYEELQREFGRLIHGEEWKTKQIPKGLAKMGAWLQDKLPLGEEPFIKPWMIELSDDHFALDITRARQMLGWEPQRSLRATLTAMVGALKADPAGWYKENHLVEPSDRQQETHADAKNGLTLESKPTGARAQRLDEKSSPEFAPAATGASLRAPWAPFVNMILGAWLVSAPFSYGYASQPMAWSDWAAGALVVLFAVLSLKPRHAWAQWANAFVGVWLLFAPLVFWAPLAAAYDTNTLIGSLVIVFSVVLPRLQVEPDSPGAEIPPGWNYNPSAWPQRAPVIAMALLGFFIARYLAAFQLGYIPKVWDPFFPDGTRRVLESEVSRAFPISDAGLGAISYMIEALTGFIGGTRRWRTMPWTVIFFGILVVPLGMVSIVLIILQPLVVGAWCTLCLVTALAMLIMISPAADEVVATIQFLRQSRRAGQPFWRTFWKGGTLDSKTTVPVGLPAHSANWATVLGLSHPTWTLVGSTALGIWLMFAPSVFGTNGLAAHNDHLIGPLVATFAVIALGEIGRAVRWLNVFLGGWLIVAPWILSGGVAASRWNDVVVGAALLVLSIPRGQIREQYGTFNRAIV